MTDELIETRCESCNRVVCTHMYEGGYGGMGYYNYKNIFVHEERRVNVPERTGTINITVCQDCTNKDPTLHSLILNKRKEWFNEQIASKKRYIENDQREIKRLRDVVIPEQRNEIIQLRKQKRELK